MEFGPIWRTMMRSKGGYILIALQIAVTMAIMVRWRGQVVSTRRTPLHLSASVLRLT
jgi:hypothetical protein